MIIKKNNFCMARFLSSLVFLLILQPARAQKDYPQQISLEILKGILKQVDQETSLYKQTFIIGEMTSDEIEFSIDTFRINLIAQKRIDIDYSTVGMIETIAEKNIAFDKLLNKYYNKLLALLSVEDKKILTKTQKIWLSFRDAESELISVMTKEDYSGGGTIQSLIAADLYFKIIEKRTIEIFNYYNSIVKDK